MTGVIVQVGGRSSIGREILFFGEIQIPRISKINQLKDLSY